MRSDQSPTSHTTEERPSFPPERYVNERPKQAIGAAIGVGFLLSLLPVGRIVGILVDVGFSLARPILLGAGVCKVSEWCRPKPAAPAKPE